MMRRRAKTRLTATCLSLAALAAFGAASAGAAFPGQGFLPGNRAWEMVSPPDKNGGDIATFSPRTRAAADGSAVGFISLAAFGDAIGTGVAVDYLAQRSTDPDPGHSGWSTHAITPRQDPNQLEILTQAIEPYYLGEFSPNLSQGLFFGTSSLTSDPYVVESALNFYRRPDLHSPGVGNYELVTACSRCQQQDVALPPLPEPPNKYIPELVGASVDLSHIAFESRFQLTPNTPGQDAFRLYEWEEGEVRLAGVTPSGAAIACNDLLGPPCQVAGISIGGVGAGATHATSLTPHAVSDGTDGHAHVFFTVPTEEAGTTVDEDSYEGNLYLRTDGVETVKLNASERDVADIQKAAQFLDAAADGSRAFFKSKEALTDGAPADGQMKLYMYDATLAPDEDNLTFMSPDKNEADDGTVEAIVGVSDDGTYVYFIARGQLVPGEPKPATTMGIYLWHEGELHYVGPAPSGSSMPSLFSSGTEPFGNPRQARVTPDGRHLLFGTDDGTGLLSRYGGIDYKHGTCEGVGGSSRCREFYLYDVTADSLNCVSCLLGAALGNSSDREGQATLNVSRGQGGTLSGVHQARAISDDGRYVFFSTAEKLVTTDTNGTTDAYLYDSTTGQPRLISSGENSARSYFLDASADGSNVFFATRERLSAWDVGSDYDIYDARIGGGFPEPPPVAPSCIGDACQPAPISLNDPTPGSAAVSGPGDGTARKPQARCAKGKRRVKARNGKSRCVKKQRQRKAKDDGRAGR